MRKKVSYNCFKHNKKIRVTIEIDKRLALHLQYPHSFEDCCYESNEVLRKVQKEIDKRLKKEMLEK